APAHGRRAVRVALLEPARSVDADAEVRDRRDLPVIEMEAARVQLPIRQEAEDLATEAVGADRGGGLERRVVAAGQGRVADAERDGRGGDRRADEGRPVHRPVRGGTG